MEERGVRPASFPAQVASVAWFSSLHPPAAKYLGRENSLRLTEFKGLPRLGHLLWKGPWCQRTNTHNIS